MRIDFSMTGISFILLAGITMLMLGICFLFMQDPIKNIKHFTARDYLIFSIIVILTVAGAAMTILGVVQALTVING